MPHLLSHREFNDFNLSPLCFLRLLSGSQLSLVHCDHLKIKKMESDYMSLFKREGLGTTIWSPLASGLLTGKYMDGMPKGTRTSLKQYKFIKDDFEPLILSC